VNSGFNDDAGAQNLAVVLPNKDAARLQRHRALAVGISLLVVVAIIVVGVLYGNRSGRHASTAKLSANATLSLPFTHKPKLVSVRLPLLVCSTTNGIPSAQPASLPSSVAVMLPANFSGRLNVYSDNQGILRLLAPQGWDCVASIGADGSGTLQIAPPNEQNFQMGHLSAGSTLQEIAASETGACVGCAEAQACPLFESASTAYQQNIGAICPTTPPPGEKTTPVGNHVVRFFDPSGIAGDGSPSGGVDPAVGAMTYNANSNNGSWTETCVLPSKRHGICSAVINSFVDSYGPR
jgi:hypothetical protein